jgi:phospho-N-acetylmuramoyl-pentapeptide-transferase
MFFIYGNDVIYHIAQILKSYLSFLSVVHYVSVRAVLGLLSALAMSFAFGSFFIETFKSMLSAKAREWTPESHKNKDNLPTMGGVFILAVVTMNILLWCDLSKSLVWIFLAGLLGFGAIGGWDDWCKISFHKGITARKKMFLQIGVAAAVVLMWLGFCHAQTTITFPFFKYLQPDIGLLFIVWAIFIIVGYSNAVNLTDGLDGLAIGSLILNFSTFALICYLAGHSKLAHYLHIPFANTAEITVIGSILVGASLGFLWYNTYPAQIFMGDVGSLALGSGLAIMALMAKQELLLLISGGLFVVETISVILQVFSFKYTGKRIFRMAPIHHHFELIGWQESKITVRFGIISFILCLLALVSLKLR